MFPVITEKQILFLFIPGSLRRLKPVWYLHIISLGQALPVFIFRSSRGIGIRTNQLSPILQIWQYIISYFVIVIEHIFFTELCVPKEDLFKISKMNFVFEFVIGLL